MLQALEVLALPNRFAAIPLGFLLGCCLPSLAIAQQGSRQLPIRSPRLAALERQLRSGNAGALENFWREVEQNGTPLVEPIPGDTKDVLVTFLWRGGPKTRNVILFSDTIPWTCASFANSLDELLRSRLVNLPDTNVYFKTCKLPRDGRFTYYLVPNDSLLLRHQRKDWALLQPDPLNPHRFAMPFEKQKWVSSTVELPGAPRATWAERRSDVPKGRVEEFRLNSNVLREKRRFWIYTPPGYSSSGKPYSLLVLFDGWEYTQIVPTPAMLDNLLAAQRLGPLVVLFVDQVNRLAELTCNVSFDDFLVSELLPWTHAHYHVSSNPADTTIGGESAGGLGAAFAGLRHSEVFGNVLSMFGYFGWEPGERNLGGDAEGDPGEWEWIIHQYAETPKLPLRFVIIAGRLDYGGELSPRPAMLASNRHMRDVLVAKGYPVVYRELAAGDALFSALVGLPDALMALAEKHGPGRRVRENFLQGHRARVKFASTTVRVLTSAPEYDDEYPSFSPNGKFIVFSRRPLNATGNSRLWMIPASGGEAHPLTPADFPLQCTRPAWSPNGKLIAFRAARRDENAGGIWLIGADGRGLRRLTDEEKADDVYPAWAPSGTWMVFSRGLITQEPSNDLWEVRLDGWQKQLTHGEKFDGKATISPDGTKIAFSTDRPDRHYPDTNIWILSVAQGEASARPFAADTGAGPAWSPDGRWIAFSSKRDGGVYIKPAEGGAIIEARNSTGKVVENAEPAWSPDGRWIAFEVADSDAHHHLEVLSVADLLKAVK